MNTNSVFVRDPEPRKIELVLIVDGKEHVVKLTPERAAYLSKDLLNTAFKYGKP